MSCFEPNFYVQSEFFANFYAATWVIFLLS